MNCRTCQNDLKKFLSLGITPLANNFLTKEELNKEELKFPLELLFCNECKLVQLGYIVPKEIMFKKYVYVSSTTKSFRKHFEDFAAHLKELFDLNESSLAVDIGSNDGIMLRGHKKVDVPYLGIEPASNIAKMANDEGLQTINAFFDEEAVKKVIEEKGKADVITASNVFAHIDDINSVIRNVKSLLKESGVFVIEIQYFLDTVETMTFDNVYHEHVSYFTLTSLINLFKKHKMNIFRVERVNTHGGSLRAFIQKETGDHDLHISVRELQQYEQKSGVNDYEWYEDFSNKVYKKKEKLVKAIHGLKEYKIAGYGAPAKGNTLLNFCNISKEISYIVEDNPLKQGLYAPGSHIPVVSSEKLDIDLPDYILILAWNFADVIMEKTSSYKEKGVKFIVPLPELKII